MPLTIFQILILRAMRKLYSDFREFWLGFVLVLILGLDLGYLQIRGIRGLRRDQRVVSDLLSTRPRQVDELIMHFNVMLYILFAFLMILNYIHHMSCMVSDQHFDDVFMLLSLVNVHKMLVLNVFEMGEFKGQIEGVWDSFH